MVVAGLDVLRWMLQLKLTKRTSRILSGYICSLKLKSIQRLTTNLRTAVENESLVQFNVKLTITILTIRY